MLITIVSFAFVFTFIALVHEFGHLLFSKLAGIRVYEFGLGFGPRLYAFKYRGTTYSLNLIPILGFVRIAGEGESAEDAECPAAEMLFSKPPLKRILPLAGGALFNVLASLLLLALVFSFWGIPKGLSNEIGIVNKGSVAASLGLQPGDVFVAFMGNNASDRMEEIITKIHENKGSPISFSVQRGNKIIHFSATPRYNAKLKMSFLGFSPKPIYSRVNFFSALSQAFWQTFGMVASVAYIVFRLFTGGISLADLAGPVGIASITGKYAQSGLISLLTFTAFISVNVGVINLLPLPALDGGHLVFVIIELILRRPINYKLINKINSWGMALLLTLMAIVTINDLFRLLSGR